MYTKAKNKTALMFFLMMLFAIVSCSDSGKKTEIFFPNPTGQAFEVLLLAEESDWNDTIGKSIRQLLMHEVYGLPQSEPEFTILQISHKAFSSIFQTHRNIIDLNISKKNKENKIQIKENIWSKPQIYIKIEAQSKEQFLEIFEKNKQAIFEILQKKELQRIQASYKKYDNATVNKKLIQEFGIRLAIPDFFELDVIKEDFAWITYETPRLSQGIFIYSENYSDTTQLSADSLILFRNKVLKQNVPGPADGSYMTTEQFVTPEYKTFLLHNQFAASLRGLWTVEGDFMGGPFFSITTINPETGKKITAEGYVYAGKQDKRNYLKQVEAIVYSMKFVKKEK